MSSFFKRLIAMAHLKAFGLRFGQASKKECINAKRPLTVFQRLLVCLKKFINGGILTHHR